MNTNTETIETSRVLSNHGVFEIEKHTGKILKFTPDRDCTPETKADFETFTKFDVEEYCKYWSEEPADTYDILDMGVWSSNGDYMGAEEGYRELVKENMCMGPVADNHTHS